MLVFTNSKGAVVTEEDIKKHEYRFQIGDGYAYYRFGKFINRRAKDPIVSLIKVQNDPRNPDDYGEVEKLIRASECARMIFWDEAMRELFAKRRSNQND